MSLKFDSTFRVELLRADDLLHLMVEGSNLEIVSDREQRASLGIKDPTRPAFLRFTFAPQTIAETAFFESALVAETKPPALLPGEPNPAGKDSKTTVDEARPAPGNLAKSATDAALAAAKDSPAGAHRSPTVAQLGHPSRLVFVVPPGVSLPFSLDGLLEWSGLELNVNAIAAIGEHPTASQVAAAPAIREPAATETALELPYRLVISPSREVVWLHRTAPFTSRGRTELWHTRLALKTDEGARELSAAAPAPLRAIWSPDFNPNELVPLVDDPELGRTAMCARDRQQIVVLTSAFHGYLGTRSPRDRGRVKATLAGPYLPLPFHAERLMLSTLGGWLRSRGEWSPPRRIASSAPSRPDFSGVFRQIARANDGPRLERAEPATPKKAVATGGLAALVVLPKEESLDLSEWVHVATQGRDHYVKIVYEGELWPFRHPAALVKVTERKFREQSGVVVAYLVQRMFIVVRQPLMVFADGDRGNPLKSVRLTTVVTPDIADPAPISKNRSFWVQVNTGGPSPVDFKFHAIATDVTGASIDFTAALLFVSRTDAVADNPDVVKEYNLQKNLARRSLDVPGQKLAFAAPDPKHPSETTLFATASLNFVLDTPRAQPTLLKAAIKIPALEELLGTHQPTQIRLFPAYVDKGADDPANATGVFAQIVDDAYTALNPANPTTALGVEIAAEKAGGLATPNMSVTTLSRALGPLAGKVDDAMTDKFDPAQFFPASGKVAKLFGSFDLLDLFLPKLDPAPSMTLSGNAPKVRTERQSGLVVTTLDWVPKFLEPSGELELGAASIKKDLRGRGTSVLEIHAKISKPVNPEALGAPPLDGASSDFSGSLNGFTVSVLDSVFIQFERFSFRKVSNQKADVKVMLDPERPLHFGKDLAFIEELRNAIPPGLFGDGPSLELVDDPPGIRAGFAFALPPLTVAVFTLKDVKLGAALTLPFMDGKPVFDFNVSERQHPFLLAVSIFGGGGFFHLQLDTAGMKALEVALEFGATAALDIGVASGEVHVMAGIYFSLQRKEGTTDLAAVLSGYLRLGGSLNVLGLISISVEFNLSFTYDSERDKAYGRATLTVCVHVLFFSASVELTVERAFGGSSDPHFSDFFPTPEPWKQYAAAFA